MSTLLQDGQAGSYIYDPWKVNVYTGPHTCIQSLMSTLVQDGLASSYLYDPGKVNVYTGPHTYAEFNE